MVTLFYNLKKICVRFVSENKTSLDFHQFQFNHQRRIRR